MRVSGKMTISLSLTCLAIAGVHGMRQLSQERRDLRQATEREIRLLGTAVQVSVQDSLRDRQLTDIQQTLDSLESIDPTVDILIFDAAETLKAQSAGSADGPHIHRAVGEAVRSRSPALRFEEAGPNWRIVLGLPLQDERGALVGSLALVRPLDEMRRDLGDTRRGIVTSMILLVIAITALQFLLGTVYVTRPLLKMAGAMKRLRSGDLSSALASTRRDEVGMLAAEFDAMVADLREARERIAREVESRTTMENALQRADKLVTIGQLSAGLAHEIGSPLQIMDGRARSLLTRAYSADEVRKNATVLAEQTDRITRIVDQLLTFSRRRPVRLAEVQLRTPVLAVMNLMEFSARRKGISLQLHGPEDGPLVWADVDQVQQVVLNLLKNALEATPAGGQVKISIDTSWLKLPDSDRETLAAKLVVEDTGCGMTREVLDRLFEPFFTTRTAEGGTGLGLAVVKSVVLNHRGTISAESTPGLGSRFTVHLPLSAPTGRTQRTIGQEAHG